MSEFILSCEPPAIFDCTSGSCQYPWAWECRDGATYVDLVPIAHEAASPFTLTLEDAYSISAAILLVWATAWGVRQVIRVIRR